MPKVLEYNATVVSKELINDHLLILKVQPEQEEFTFVPGQYATLGLKQSAKRIEYAKPEKDPNDDPEFMIRRAYSIASSPHESALEFYLAFVEDGTLTPRLFALEVGDKLFLNKKAVGKFTLDDVEEDKDLILMSTGTGLAPYISMLRHQFNWDTNRKTVVLHGVRHETDLGYRQELEALDEKYENFYYVPVLSRDNPGWEGMKGYIQNVLFSDPFWDVTQLSLNSDETEVYICGNPAMIEQAIEGLEKRDFTLIKARQPGNIHIEEYW